MAKQTATETNQSGTLKEFFSDLGKKAESTKSGYRTNIVQFLRWKNPGVKIDSENCSQYADQYFASSPDVYSDFKQYLHECISDRPALSGKQTFTTLKNFFEMVTDTAFSPKEIKVLKNQIESGSDAASEETQITSADLRKIYSFLDVKNKAIIATLATGGMRISDCLTIRISDVNFNTVPTMIKVQNKKTGARERTTCISSEATTAIQDWLKIRDANIAANANRAERFNTGIAATNTKTDLLFPVSQQSVNEAFRDAVIKAFGDNAVCSITGRSKRHIHGLRKFCNMALSSAAIPQGMIDVIIGHKTALGKAYDKFSDAEICKAYSRAEPYLMFVSDAELISENVNNSGKYEALKDSQYHQQSIINRLTNEKAEQAERLNELERKMSILLEYVSNSSAAPGAGVVVPLSSVHSKITHE
jgi:integrase